MVDVLGDWWNYRIYFLRLRYVGVASHELHNFICVSVIIIDCFITTGHSEWGDNNLSFLLRYKIFHVEHLYILRVKVKKYIENLLVIDNLPWTMSSSILLDNDGIYLNLLVTFLRSIRIWSVCVSTCLDPWFRLFFYLVKCSPKFIFVRS